MTLHAFLTDELEREIARSRRALAEVPAGKHDWKPHEKSMALGYLSTLVATIPSWIARQIVDNALDVAPQNGSTMPHVDADTQEALLTALEASAAEAREALATATDVHLHTTWQLKAHGVVVLEAPRHEMIQDTMNHWAHHRGQLTVYLRLLGAKVPALYGPSADDQRFA